MNESPTQDMGPTQGNSVFLSDQSHHSSKPHEQAAASYFKRIMRQLEGNAPPEAIKNLEAAVEQGQQNWEQTSQNLLR